jgi:K(+)-stimulated pyrophosphate-energized sodium pump
MFENLFWIGFVGAALALVFALVQSRKVLKFSEGTDKMKTIAAAIRSGANAYLKRQYAGVLKVFIVVFIILLILAFNPWKVLLAPFVPFAFLTGGIYSGLAGFIGMRIATSANARTAQAAHEGLNRGLKVAFSSGSVMGFTVVGLGILDITVWIHILKYGFHCDPATVGSTMVMFGMGASFMALFARVGGGIFTKAADVGADLVGKVEAGIPEDDPRNPAVIADNVGDNVGDVAGMGADLYESYVGSILASFALGVSAGYGWNGIFMALALGVVGIIAALIGTFFIRTGESTDQKTLLSALRRGTYIAAILAAVAAIPLSYFIMGQASWVGIFVAILSGLVAGVLIGYFTEYYTSDTYKPTRELAETTQTGPATVIIGGISLGMKSTCVPIIVVGAAILVSYFAAGGGADPAKGLFGIGIAAVGMLSTLGITLATDAYGPVADNAGGIAEMSGLGEEVRERTDALDGLGNTTAATGKGFAIGSAALTALALLVSYIDLVKAQDPDILNLSITNPPLLVGIFLGAMLAFLFSALTMSAVGRAAQSIVVEVRRQFREIKGIMEGTGKPDYESCIDLCTRSAQKEMIMPSLLAIIVPVIVGLILGVNGVVGLLAGVTVTGFALAVFMSNAGGAWDNAKKYIEAGHLGGKGSENHKAAVVGDTVGDPFKDTSGPSLNILIKLVSTVSIVFSSLIIAFHLM